MPTFSHDGIEFHFRSAGEGVPFVFQHGLGADGSQTFGLFTPPPGLRLLTLDCRAHGETHPVGDEAKLNVATFADDVRALLDHLGIERAVIGGISMGAATALHFALTHPDRTLGLVLSRPAWLDERRTSGFEAFAVIAGFLRRYGPVEGAARFQELPEFVRLAASSPDNAQSMLGQFAAPRALEQVAKLERIPQHQPSFTRADWRRIAVPTLVLGNRQDAIHPFDYAEAYAREIPGAQLVELTPKSVSKERHTSDTAEALGSFLKQWLPPERGVTT